MGLWHLHYSLYITDTLRVVGLTEIMGATYFELSRTRNLQYFFPAYLRHAGQQVVDEMGRVFIPGDAPTDVFQRDTVFGAVPSQAPIAAFRKRLIADKESVSVPAGVYSCLDIATDIILFDPDDAFGERTTHDYFAEAVGLVQKDLLYSQADLKMEIRLKALLLE